MLPERAALVTFCLTQLTRYPISTGEKNDYSISRYLMLLIKTND